MSQRGRGGGFGSLERVKVATVMSPEQKLILATFVRDNKAMLVGKFSPMITQKKRDAKWTEIFENLLELGAVIQDVETLRFGIYRSMIKATTRKRDAAAATGAGPPAYTDLDEVVRDIIGRDSAAVKGIGDGNDDFPVYDEENSNELSNLNTTSESEFRMPLNPRQLPLPFARRSTPLLPLLSQNSTLTSSPIRGGQDDTLQTNGENRQDTVNTQQVTVSSSGAFKRKTGPPTSILVDEQYKVLRVEKLKLEIEDQKLRLELVRFQIEAEKNRAAFFKKAELSLTGQHTLKITSEADGVIHMPM